MPILRRRPAGAFGDSKLPHPQASLPLKHALISETPAHPGGLELPAQRAYAIGMSFINLLALWLMLGSDIVVGPLYPSNAVSGGTVVAELVSGTGGVSEIKILSGAEPFVSSSRAALQRWNLHPEKNGGDLVVVHFRQPNLYYMGDAQEEISCAGADPSMPCPKYVVGPAYPAQAEGQGSVILKVDVAADGSILKVGTIQAMGVLTDVSVAAVRKWKFTPAEDARGVKEASHAYAVFVYRFPVINTEK